MGFETKIRFNRTFEQII